MKRIAHFGSYVVMLAAMSGLGGFIESTCQPGGMSRLEGFLVPPAGPWSRIMTPPRALIPGEALHLIVWTLLFVMAITASAAAGDRLKVRWQRIIARILGYVVIVWWCWHGIADVLSELT